jgi:nicotinamide-nucleotide adenylyltransferase
MPKKSVGLLIGRFQPFHNGHLAAVKYALEHVDYLYIVVGSAQRSHERDNPFTAGERIMMIKAALNDAGVDARRWMLIPINDAQSHSVWTATLKSTVPRFDTVFSNDTLTIRLLKEEGINVKAIPYLNRDEYSATNVRARILERRDWKTLVPPAVERMVKELDGVERVRSMISKDSEES